MFLLDLFNVLPEQYNMNNEFCMPAEKIIAKVVISIATTQINAI
jgi:hypothetical protein